MGTDKNRVRTLAIDIGGSGLKMLVLDQAGDPITERSRVNTPNKATPSAVMKKLQEMISKQGEFERISVGFPGVVVDGKTLTAVNLDDEWKGFDLAKALEEAVDKPTRVANDADVQGLGAVEGKGVELVLTLGTGMGSALFHDGRLLPNLELAHHPFHKGKTYEDWLGNPALEKIGKKKWSRRVEQAISALDVVFNFRVLYLGGGNAKRLTIDLPGNVQTIQNISGLLGGIALWKD